MKAKTKRTRRTKPVADARTPAGAVHAPIAELLREEEELRNKPGLPLGTIMQSGPGGKTVFRLSLLCRTRFGNDRTITEIERRFLKDTISTYTPESIADEILWWGIPRRILDDALRDPDDAKILRALHWVFPGAIFCFRETLGSLTRRAVTALVSNDAIEIQKAKRWLETVLYVHHKKNQHTISLGVRQLGLFPRLYGEIIFLKKASSILRKRDRYSSLAENRFVESTIRLFCEELDIPKSGKATTWLLNILSSASQEPAYKRPISAAAKIISECTQLMDSKPGSKASGYQATSIRKYISLIHSDWTAQRVRIEKTAKTEADAFCKTIDIE